MSAADPREELAALTRSAAALLHWEQELSGLGVPPSPPREASAPSAAPPSEPAQHTTDASSVAKTAPTSPEPTAAPEPAPTAISNAPALSLLATEAAACTACRLHEGRTRSAFARGSEHAELLFVGEGPGYHEDQEGLPFVGPAGALLDKMILAMGYDRDDVYICNVVKCRPPENRAPRDDEAEACSRFLDAQVDQVAPKAIVALGRSAAERLHVVEPEGSGWRGRWSTYRSVPVLATYHPAYLLRTPQAKRQVWDDLQDVMRRIGRELPPRP